MPEFELTIAVEATRMGRFRVTADTVENAEYLGLCALYRKVPLGGTSAPAKPTIQWDSVDGQDRPMIVQIAPVTSDTIPTS